MSAIRRLDRTPTNLSQQNRWLVDNFRWDSQWITCLSLKLQKLNEFNEKREKNVGFKRALSVQQAQRIVTPC